ncbi:MAG: hypothetical protein GXP31_17410 [Kiritimatiellaeota bacterium]|nr:hypothetical protein [Kiritimatiellota bacterium]
MAYPGRDRSIVRNLAARVAEIAALPAQRQRRDLWVRLNRLERTRPLIHIQALAQNIWEELIPEATLLCEDRFCRAQELELRKRIYCWERFADDRVTSAVVASPITIRGDAWSTGFGIRRQVERSAEPSGAYAFVPVITDLADIAKIEVEPEVSVDWEATERTFEALSDLYDGVLPVEKRGRDFFWFAPMDQFITWRGIEQTFVDLIERPDWVHEALERITQGYLHSIRQMEDLGLLSPGHGNTLLGSGGYGWTDCLPQDDFDGTHVRLRDLWARAATQIFTNGISPEMHEEFAIRYEKRLLECFGLSCYGCCEPLDRKMHVVRKIVNLRRVSMSPWVDLDRAAAAVGRDYVLTHKPNPTVVSMEGWHPDLARAQLREAFEKTRDNVVEVNLQDLHTVRNEPHRLTEWAAMAMELAEEYA